MTGRIDPRAAPKVSLGAVAMLLYLLGTNGAIAQGLNGEQPVPVPPDSADMTAIHAAVFDYFEGINEQDKGRIERAFDPSAQLKSPTDNGAVQGRADSRRYSPLDERGQAIASRQGNRG